ncbi:hypothetical protein RhiirC2_774651 [Rhizophagus irregularis]|uniref:Uncharacterized protein n=1 Tax=Rhizophagus irregularis TaxID=588596 RepID=A0A2N1NL41_9GLOM|nr:hypothetical protein RhiirC2_774651 [Rhizophagus irregularis]
MELPFGGIVIKHILNNFKLYLGVYMPPKLFWAATKVKVLVFGATGFVGFSVSQALARLETFEELTRNETCPSEGINTWWNSCKAYTQ